MIKYRKFPRSQRGFFLVNPFSVDPPGGGDGDPYFSMVTMLLHFDGADGSIVFTDELGGVWTRSNVAEISTDQSRFGGASGNFQGTGPRIQNNNPGTALDFGTGDFTIEGWTFCNSNAGSSHIFDWWPSSGNFRLLLRINTNLQFYFAANTIFDISPPSVSAWHHIAVTRESGTFRIFVDGALAGTNSSLPSISYTNSPSTIVNIGGSGSSADSFDGFIDEFRVTKGLARYTAAFTPPSAPFPDFGPGSETNYILTRDGDALVTRSGDHLTYRSTETFHILTRDDDVLVTRDNDQLTHR